MIGQTFKIKNNTFFVEKKSKKKLPYSIITFFLIMQLIFGFDFGFVNVLNKKIRPICKFVSTLVCLFICAILLLCTPIFISDSDIRILWGSMIFVQYCGHIIMLHFSKNKVLKYITDIRCIDDDVIYSKEYKIGWFACINFGITFVITITLSAVICIVTNSGCMLENKIVNVFYMISVTGLDAIVYVQLIANFYTYYAVTYLVGLVGREEISLIRKQFLRVSECWDKFGGYYGNLFIMELLIHLPKYLLLVCNFIYNFQENVMWKSYLTQLSYSMHVINLMCAPAVSVEIVNKQMDRLRFKLYTRLMEERGGRSSL